MIGSTDSHTGLATAGEESFFGKHSGAEPNADRWKHPMARIGDRANRSGRTIARGPPSRSKQRQEAALPACSCTIERLTRPSSSKKNTFAAIGSPIFSTRTTLSGDAKTKIGGSIAKSGFSSA